MLGWVGSTILLLLLSIEVIDRLCRILSVIDRVVVIVST